MTSGLTNSTVAPGADVATVRIAVLVSTFQVDVVVPTKFTIETFIDDLLVVLAAAIEDQDIDLRPPRGQWSLARPGSGPIPRWNTLGDHDIVDGTVLMLTVAESSETFTPVVEDITDALALINEREFAEFDSHTASVVGLALLGTAASTVAAMSIMWWTEAESPWWCGIPSLVLGIGCLIAGVVGRRFQVSGRTSLALGLSCVPLLFAGAALLVPAADQSPKFAAAQVAAGALVAAVGAVTFLRSTGLGTGSMIAVGVVGALTAVTALPLMYFDVTVRQASGFLLFAGLLLLTGAPRIAVVIARIRPPDLPDPGNDVSSATLTDIFDAEAAAAGDSAHDQPDRNTARGIENKARVAVASLRGLIVAACAVLVAGAVLTNSVSPGGIREIVVATATAGILAMRSRWFPDRVQATSLVLSAAVIAVGVGFVLLSAYRSPMADVAIMAAIAAAGCAGWAGCSRLPDRRLSPVTRRVIDLIEYLLILSVPVIAFWIMDVYTAMREI
ncbi:type VII secretion integral membrane protein EccD [Nocardia neocaledoniensis NBRC 108232]|uniref:Type VII secretion integral membrane protein EccD n=1 Tax=Nocardia neocaledoniensis TaxID=236511 RepID=A0A317N2R1_9NOCA|nr:type VII secretion integral membrane protein EccD [Nocardia neocaledoniensis]PWV66964.1 type VII secretion integral membrane protein EccD [Nocardia neocaledoniensis]GEM31299.1 type VII secretion integral membrane protein EccD [Nocardia neocaledoniensis NBRC 108232]